MRRLSGSSMQPRGSALSTSSMSQRRFSVQTDGSQYLPPNMNHFTASQQSRFHCIQKQPLRNVLSAPQSNFNMDLSRQPNSLQCFGQQPLMQRQDSIQSVDSDSAASELARYKTELCRPFEETGECRYGNKCQFAHGKNELRVMNRHPRYKTELCRTYHTTGFCSYGQRCNFIHNDEERRGPACPPVSRVQSQQHRLPGAILPFTAPLSIASGGESSASSISSGSPSQSPHYLNDEVFPSTQRLSPTPSFGSDGNSLASSGSFTPPASPKHDPFYALELGFDLSILSGLTL